MPNRILKTTVTGAVAEEATVAAAAATPANQAGRIPELNADGFVDPTLLNAGKLGGNVDANRLAQLDAGGKLTAAMMPTGFGQDSNTITATEALSGANVVNVHSGGVRKADANTGREGMGFVQANVASGQPATVFFEGTCGGLTGLVPGKVFLDPSTPGGVTQTPPVSGSGKLLQCVGVAVSPNAFNFQYHPGVQLL